MDLDSVFGDDDDPAGADWATSSATTDEPESEPEPAPGTRTRVRTRKRKRKRSKLKLALIITGCTLLLLGVGVVVAGYLAVRHFDNNVQRVPNVFNTSVLPPQGRPTVVPAAKNAMNLLLVGSDSRAGQQTTGTGGDSGAPSPIGQRTDTMMLVHIDSSKKNAWIVSLPRDSWVPIPGHGVGKINWAFSYGGPALMIATVEALTNVHIDHYAEIDFEGFKSMTDAVGGVDVKVQHAFSSQGYTFPVGIDHMDGDKALVFVRNRYQQPNSDFSRINDQHQFVLALMQKVSSLSPFTSPTKLLKLLDTFTKSISVDATFTGSKLRDFAWSLRDLKPDNVQFLTAPYTGTGMVGDQSVVFLDKTVDAGLWTALRDDTMSTWTP